MSRKRLKEKEYPSLQVSEDKKSYRILISVAYIRHLEEQIGREFTQGEPWELTLLPDEPGIKAVPR
jgi:hypothetical protein